MKKSFLVVLSLFVTLTNQARAEDILEALAREDMPEVTQVNHPFRKSMIKELNLTTAEQTIFLDQFFSKQFDKALYQYYVAFSPEFRQSGNGQAILSFLVFQNQLTTLAVESLFQISSPDKLAPVVQKMWRAAAPVDHAVWMLASVKWNEGWRDIFGAATEVRSQSRTKFSEKDLEYLNELVASALPNSPEGQQLQWQRSQVLALTDQTAEAAKALKQLLSQKSLNVPTDEIYMLIGRLLYQAGHLQAGIEYYSKVPKASLNWFDAQDEIAWSYLRLGQPQNSLSVTQTLMSPLLKGQVRAESYFLHQLANLKVCDYPEVMNNLEAFKAEFRPKAQQLLSLLENVQTDKVNKLLVKLESGPIARAQYAKDFKGMPLPAASDAQLIQLVRLAKQLKKEITFVETLHTKSITGASSQVGFVGEVAYLKSGLEKKYQAARSSSYNRVRTLASRELKEIKNALEKAQIVEAEVIQQIQMAGKVLAATKNVKDDPKKADVKATADAMKFPFEGEHWFDELSNYKMDLKRGCLAKQGATK